MRPMTADRLLRLLTWPAALFIAGILLWQEHYKLTVHPGGSLAPGTRLPGPLLIAEPTTTIVVPPASTLLVTALGNYLIELS